jgi:hypothetical protein
MGKKNGEKAKQQERMKSTNRKKTQLVDTFFIQNKRKKYCDCMF